MADLPLTLTCADYPRIMPLVTRQVVPKGIDLTLITGRGGSWPDRAEMLRRGLQDPAVQGGESSMMIHLSRIDKGDRSHVGLPIFPAAQLHCARLVRAPRRGHHQGGRSRGQADRDVWLGQ